MTLEEAQQEIIRLTDVNKNLESERDNLKEQLETVNNGSIDKDKEIERLREHNNLLWQRCSTQPITPKQKTIPQDEEEEEKIEIKSVDEIIAEIN